MVGEDKNKCSCLSRLHKTLDEKIETYDFFAKFALRLT